MLTSRGSVYADSPGQAKSRAKDCGQKASALNGKIHGKMALRPSSFAASSTRAATKLSLLSASSIDLRELHLPHLLETQDVHAAPFAFAAHWEMQFLMVQLIFLPESLKGHPCLSFPLPSSYYKTEMGLSYSVH